MAVDLAPSPKRNRTRSPSYPYLDLPAALEKAAVLWQAEGRHPVAVNLAMQHWGYKEESSTGYSCIAALKKFGLVDHEGMGETRQVRLSNLALTHPARQRSRLRRPPRRPAQRRARAPHPRRTLGTLRRGAAQRPIASAVPGAGPLLQRGVRRRAAGGVPARPWPSQGLSVGPVRGGSSATTPAPVAAAAAGFAPLPPVAPVPTAALPPPRRHRPRRDRRPPPAAARPAPRRAGGLRDPAPTGTTPSRAQDARQRPSRRAKHDRATPPAASPRQPTPFQRGRNGTPGV